MDIQDLNFSYPLELIATKSKKNFRILFTKITSSAHFKEINKISLLDKFQQGDVLVINNTKVIKRRIFATKKFVLKPTKELVLDILFVKKIEINSESLKDINLTETKTKEKTETKTKEKTETKTETEPETWEVLFSSKKMQIGETLNLPEGVGLKLIKKSIPQIVEVNKALSVEYFQKYGQMPLPPYIQKVRGKKENIKTDEADYQTAWAKYWGSCAAPTASLHFTQFDLDYLKQKRKVKIVELTLHIGLGTFLPIKVKNLSEHKMHKECVCIPLASLKEIVYAKNKGYKVWALGTTVTRALETWALETKNLEGKNLDKDFITESELFIKPGFCFKVVDVLMTNFHQPKSTLLAMLMAFAGKSKVLKAYKWAIEKKFRLFSYGDLSIWEKGKL